MIVGAGAVPAISWAATNDHGASAEVDLVWIAVAAVIVVLWGFWISRGDGKK